MPASSRNLPPPSGEIDEIRAAIRVRDFGKAVPLLETLASSGNPDAQYQLAALYRAGSGVSKDHETAFYWVDKAAKQNHRQAQYNLGVMYEYGWGTPASAADAADWYEKAAAQGHPMAQEKLNPGDIAARRTRDNAQPGQPPDPDLLLRRAVIRGDLQSAIGAIKAGANVDSTDKYGRTALIEAAEQGFTEIVQLLTGSNAGINHKDSYNNSALLLATGNGHLDTVKALLAANADSNATDTNGNTPLMIASGRNDRRDCPCIDSTGRTPSREKHHG